MCRERKLVVCTIGKTIYPRSLKDNRQDLQTFTALAERIDRLYLIVQSYSHSFSLSRYKNIVALLVPHLKNHFLNHLWFIIMGFILGVKLNSRMHIDIFQASEPTGSGIAGIILKLITGKKFLLHLQGDLFNLPRSQFSWLRVAISQLITRIVCKFADKVRCVSQSLMTEAKRADIPQRKLVLVPSRCDVQRFNPQVWQNARGEVRRQLGVDNKKVVMFIGTLSVHKGLSYLLKAMPQICSLYPETAVVLVGSGPLMDELKSLALELGIADKTIFCGRIPYEQIPAYLSAADIFAFPSIDEGLPRAVMEAMAMELPVVGTKVGGIPELVQNGQTGFLVDPCNPQQIADALNLLLQKPHLASEMGRSARNEIVSNYSFEEGIKRYISLIYEVSAD